MSRTANAGDILGYMAAGVTGFILETSGHVEVHRAVRDISTEIYMPPDVIAPTACGRTSPGLHCRDCRR
jgi:hypothetical protein